jgi:hypothetical protein
MKAKKKKCTQFVFFSLILLIIAAAVWFFQFNPTGYRMSVPYRSSFEKISDNVYVNKYYAGNRDEIADLMEDAKTRDAFFFGSLTCLDHTVIIICDEEKLLAKLGGDHDTQTVLFPVKKSYISISTEYLNVDVLAHELTHSIITDTIFNEKERCLQCRRLNAPTAVRSFRWMKADTPRLFSRLETGNSRRNWIDVSRN